MPDQNTSPPRAGHPPEAVRPAAQERPVLLVVLGVAGILGCLIFAVAVIVADIVVPDKSAIADTISDLGAGRYEYIVDIGIYAFSLSLIACAIAAAHAHLGETGWSVGLLGLALAGLVVFLVGARNEYGDADSDGVIIHMYLVYALGVIFAVVPWAMSGGADRAGKTYGRIFRAVSAVWVVAAPVFLVLPTDIDGIYERGLGVIVFCFIIPLSWLFLRRGRATRAG
ncbi:DUF998 domain-containing protein [Pseudooctadecabacter sp.]|uniref:DUF998 domain-containing protein n=1 Tax=Pseudooctadecabacter sp. TaxID=1966338 RepID=UPI0025EBB26D|nr:DUF998 domain-containing protein [Pseudooctadecabacter sp.]